MLFNPRHPVMVIPSGQTKSGLPIEILHYRQNIVTGDRQTDRFGFSHKTYFTFTAGSKVIAKSQLVVTIWE